VDRNALLKMAGFSERFISELEDYDNSVIEIIHDDFSLHDEPSDVGDSKNMILERVDINARTKMIISEV